MAAQITELTFLQHLAPRFNLPVPEFLTADASGSEIRAALKKWGGQALLKPDILSGKRGKAGAIRKTTDYADAQRQMKQLMGAEVRGRVPRTAYMVQFIPSEIEVYTAITYDSRYASPSLTVSLEGGMDIEDVPESKKATVPIDIFRGFAAFQASQMLEGLGCPRNVMSLLARHLVDLWDMFITTGMRMCEVNPWRVTPDGKPYACDFKATFDESNFKFQNIGFAMPEYPANASPFEEDMAVWNASSHRGQAHVAELGGHTILPILFGGGASTIITETLVQNGGDPIFLSDFGGNPPYERMYGTAKICFDHKLKDAGLLLILGGKANNTMIDVTFKAIGDALVAWVEENGPIDIPVVVGRGGPRLVQGMVELQNALESLQLPYVMFGPDTPVTMVAEYAAKLARAYQERSTATHAG